MMTWNKLTLPQASCSMLIALLMIVSSTLLNFLCSSSVCLTEWELTMTGAASINFNLLFDKMSLTFSLTVLVISLSVMLFSTTYMSGDPNLNYFILMVMLFVLSMNFLIFIPHLIFLLLGWDGLGLSSYLLVIYYQNEGSLSAGMITAVTNRIGDSLLIIAGAWGFMTGSWNQTFNLITGCGLWFSLVVMVASMTKSAQLPFSAWLPAAMAAPTPVSSLVHSSTLVTAGVYLLIRFYPTLSVYSLFSSYVFIVGVLTCTMASLSALFENDLKKVIALSTLSQLGVMMLSLGMNQPLLAFFHLITHALFKALLFICAGTVIHSMQGAQDLRLMGNLWMSMPATCSCLNIANLALCGIPFTAGFYSKDLILEVMFSSPMSAVSWGWVSLTICLTAAYSVRLSVLTLWSSYKHYAVSTKNDESFYTFMPSMTLLLGAVTGGALMSWTAVPYMVSFSLPFLMKTFALLFIMLYGLLSWNCSLNSIILPSKFFQSSMWFLGFLHQPILSLPTIALAKSYVNMELSWMELISGLGLLSAAKTLSKPLAKNQMLTLEKMITLLALIMTFLLIAY